jgi:hypothetical protein
MSVAAIRSGRSREDTNCIHLGIAERQKQHGLYGFLRPLRNASREALDKCCFEGEMRDFEVKTGVFGPKRGQN